MTVAPNTSTFRMGIQGNCQSGHSESGWVLQWEFEHIKIRKMEPDQFTQRTVMTSITVHRTPSIPFSKTYCHSGGGLTLSVLPFPLCQRVVKTVTPKVRTSSFSYIKMGWFHSCYVWRKTTPDCFSRYSGHCDWWLWHLVQSCCELLRFANAEHLLKVITVPKMQIF